MSDPLLSSIVNFLAVLSFAGIIYMFFAQRKNRFSKAVNDQVILTKNVKDKDEIYDPWRRNLTLELLKKDYYFIIFLLATNIVSAFVMDTDIGIVINLTKPILTIIVFYRIFTFDKRVNKLLDKAFTPDDETIMKYRDNLVLSSDQAPRNT